MTGSTMLIVQSGTPDLLGTVAAQSESCPSVGVTGTKMLFVNGACSGVSDIHAEVQSSAPSGKVRNHRFYRRRRSNRFYEVYTFGASIIESVVHKGYAAAQISFQMFLWGG